MVKPFPLSLTLSTEPELSRQLASQNASRVAEASAHLQSMVPVEADARGVPTEFEILENGNVAEAICQAWESFDADLVCIGAHARPGAAARMMVALGVLQHCRRPVLVVWPPAACPRLQT